MNTSSTTVTIPPLIQKLSRFIREPINGISHFIGILLSITGLVFLLHFSQGEPWRLTAFAIYGSSLILLYTASTLLHSIHANPYWYRVLRTFDHAAIFVLIAGSYTPIALITLRPEAPSWGWSILSIVWGIAILGVVFKFFWLHAPRWLSTSLYLGMGWIAMSAIVPLVQNLERGGLILLGLGGVFYSLGAVIYASKRPNFYPNVFGFHELWHLFVLAGSISHYLMMFFYILPRG